MRSSRPIVLAALLAVSGLAACRPREAVVYREAPSLSAAQAARHHHHRCRTAVISDAALYLWNLGQPNPPLKDDDLERASVVAIALLAAFLTAVQVWQIPPPTKRITAAEPDGAEAEKPAAKSKAAGGAKANQAADLSALFLSNNFARTVLSGFTGLAAVTFLDSFWKGNAENGLSVKSYYLVLFVVLFLVILLLSATLQGLNEALRSRIILSRPAIPPLLPLPESKKPSPGFLFRRWAGHWLHRLWNWIASWRLAIVVFVDTFFNFIQGQSQLRAAVFSDHIVDLHESMVQAAEQVCSELHRAVLQALSRHGALPPDLPLAEKIRVGVSLLSFDQSKVYYIAHERGSLPQAFDRYSVAWVAAFVGEARWCKSGKCNSGYAVEKPEWNDLYAKNHDAVLAKNSGKFPGPDRSLLLPQYYQVRDSADYEAFVVLPMPWTHRGMEGDHRRGCIHISFKESSYMDRLWVGLEGYAQGDGKRVHIPNYEAWRGLLEPFPVSADPDWQGEPKPADGVRSEHPGEKEAKKEKEEKEAKEIEADNIGLRTSALAALMRGRGLKQAPPAWVEKAVRQPLFIVDGELAAVLHQALEVLGAALAHFDDEVYDDYVQLRLHSGTS